MSVAFKSPTLASLVRGLVARRSSFDPGPPSTDGKANIESPQELRDEELVERLASAMALRGENDPTHEEADHPWRWGLRRLLPNDSGMASQLARRWYSVLVHADLDSEAPVKHRALAAYVVGVIEALRGNDAVADRWLEIGRTEADFDEAGVAVFEQACAFVQEALHRRRGR